MPATNVWHLDDAVSFEIGGIHDPMGNAFHTALVGTEMPGQDVLVTGCGPIGIFAVGICQRRGCLAHHRQRRERHAAGAGEEMGAHDAVHPERGGAIVKGATEGLGVDVVLEMSGVPAAIHQAFALVRVGGRVQMLGIPAKPMDLDFATEVIFKGLTVYGVVGRRMYETWHPDDALPALGRIRPDAGDHASFSARERGRRRSRRSRAGDAGKVIFEVA